MAVCLFITGGEEKSCKSRPGLEPKHLAASNKVNASVTPQSSKPR